MGKKSLLLLSCMCVLLLLSNVSADAYTLSPYSSLNNGSGETTNANVVVQATIGQALAGESASDGYQLQAGFQNISHSFSIGTGLHAPTASITVDLTTVVSGNSSTLTWITTGADMISIDQGIGSVAASGSMEVTPTTTTTYMLTATGPGGTVTETVVVTVTSSAPTASITVDPNPIVSGNASTLTWKTAGADTVTIDQGIGAVPASGSKTVSPSATTIYTIFATGPGGTATATATLTLNLPPTVTLSANPASIIEYESSNLTWNAANATTVSIDQGVGTVAPSGSASVSPVSTTTYTITATGPGGTATSSTTVTVAPAVTLSAEITASPGSIYLSGFSTLNWNTISADSISIDQGIGSVATSGFLPVNPARTTTYTITATNPNGTATDSVTVTVNYPKPPGIYYEYDELGRIKKITRIPSP